jgi:hypothetical protein
MGFGPILEGLAKSLEASKTGAPEALRAMLTPAIPQAAERLAAPEAQLLKGLRGPETVTERAQGIPFVGNPELQAATRSTEQKVNTVEDMTRAVKRGFLSLTQADPDLPKDIQRKLIDARHAENMADELAAKTLRDVHAPILGDARRIAHVFDYAVTADEVAQAASDGRDTIHGQPVEKWISQLDAMKKHMDKDPISAQVIKNRQAMWDAIHQDMVDQGAIIPERYKEGYTPLRHISSVVRGLANVTGDKGLVQELSAAQRRTGGVGPRETNLAVIEHKVISKYLKWKAMKNSFTEMMADPSLNRTGQYHVGDVLPHGWSIWNPGPGLPGYEPKEPDAEMLSGLMKTLYEKRKTTGLTPEEMKTFTNARQQQARLVTGGYVIPTPLADAFNNFAKTIPSQASNGAYKAGALASRWLTVYNPRNTFLNLMSDLPVAMLGLPGEQAHPLGVLKFYTTGLRSGLEHAFTGKSRIVEINGQKIDLSGLINQEAVGGTTHMAQITGGQTIHPELKGLVPEDAARNPLQILGDYAKNFRQGVELAPRIAAGLDALQRTGSTKEFGRVARASTLEYGAGAPLASKQPAVRLISPFLQFAGLAIGRVTDLIGTQGSRARSITAVAALPVITMMWNMRNSAFRQVNDAVPDYERQSPYLIIPDPKNPDEPLRDIEGKPVVWRFRLSVPEQAMQMVGLGNLAPRIGRVVAGQDKPMDFLKDTGQGIGESIASQLTTPGLVDAVARGQDRFGNDLDVGQKLMRVAPLGKVFAEGYSATKDYGPAEGAKRAAEELTGFSAANIERRGKTLMDATLLAHTREIKSLTAKYRTAVMNKSPSEQKKWRDRRTEAVKELREYIARKKDTKNFTEADASSVEDAMKEGQ